MNQSSTTSMSINLRTKGLRTTTGSLVKGCVRDATSKLSIGSIPSNYQTIIYHSQSTKAFGTSQKRFYQQTKSQLEKTDIINNDSGFSCQQQVISNPSYSTKGYGPLIAKQERNWIEKSQAPGPGRYQFTQSAQPTTKRLKKHRSNFNYSKKHITQQHPSTPGPGKYHIHQTTHANNGWRSSFKTTMNRNTYLQNKNNPGPGYYDARLVKHAKCIIKEPINGLDQKSSANKKSYGMVENQRKCEVPGPGAYQYEIPTFKPLYEKIKISGNFMLSKKDRFNNQAEKLADDEPVQEAPDVYSYTLKSEFDQQKRLIKWPCFMSQSKRMQFDDGKRLGPSFIVPKIQDRKNFHFNIKGAWF